MKNTLLLSVFFSFFFYSNSTAQSDNKQKILGCWEVRQVIFTTEVEESEELSMEAIGSVICFDSKGNFTNKKGEMTLKGTYKLSENGRTLYQKALSDVPAPSNTVIEDVPGQIMMLSDEELQIQAEEMILYLRKSN